MKIGDPVTVLNREDPDWWIGENENTGVRGMFPASAVKRQGIIVRPREDFTPNAEDEDEQISFEFGDFIEVLDWDDPDWWRGRNLTNGETGEFHSEMVFLPDEWLAEEARVQAEFAAEEERLRKDELQKMGKLAQGLAANDRADGDPAGPGTADGRRAMRTLFSLMDWNSNGTVERYDMLRSVALDTNRRSAMVELGLGRLRYWLLPAQWTHLFALMQYEQSCIERRKFIDQLPVVRVKIPGFEAAKSGESPSVNGVSDEDLHDDALVHVEQNMENASCSQERFSTTDHAGGVEAAADHVNFTDATRISNVSSADGTSSTAAEVFPDTKAPVPAEMSSFVEVSAPAEAPIEQNSPALERDDHEVRVVVRRRIQRTKRGEAIDASTVNVDVVDDCGGIHRLRLPLKLLRSYSPAIEDLSTLKHVKELVR